MEMLTHNSYYNKNVNEERKNILEVLQQFIMTWVQEDTVKNQTNVSRKQ